MANELKNIGEQIGEQIGGEVAGEIGKEIGQIAQWLKEPLNQWKLKLVISVVGIPLVVGALNTQFFFRKLVGLKIPKLLPDMPWWELLILGIVDMILALLLLIQLSPVLIYTALGCRNWFISWFAC